MNYTKSFPAAKRTICVQDYYLHGPDRNFFLQFPPITFGMIYNAYRQLPMDSRVGITFDNGQNFYIPPNPNMFGYSVCLEHMPNNIDKFITHFWNSVFGTQIDAVAGLLCWFGNEHILGTYQEKLMGRACFGLTDRRRFSHTSSDTIISLLDSFNVNLAPNQIITSLIFDLLTEWEKISRRPNAVEILQEIAETRNIISVQSEIVFPTKH
jgi:hypothetical protein